MIQRQTLSDGSVQISSEGCAFVYTRLRAGAVLITIAGDDDGSLGSSPFDELTAEIARFGPVHLFVDARHVTGVAVAVTEQWASWFRANRAGIKRVRVLVTSKLLHITASMVHLFSRTGDLMRIDGAVGPFERELAREAPGFAWPPLSSRWKGAVARPSPAERPRAETASWTPVQREITNDGSVRLWSSSCSFVYTTLRPGVMLVTISGDDGGELGPAPLAELDAEIARFGPLDLFVDATAATGAETAVSEQWTSWFRDNRARLARVSILAPSKLMHLIVSVAKLLSRTGEMIRIYTTAEPFEQAIAREVPGFGGRAAAR